MFAKRLSRTALLVAVVANPMLADSDGYLCTSSKYLAYEVGTPGHSAHELRVVSLVPPLNDRSLRSIRLPDFQVHGILCHDEEVLILGWDHLFTVSVLPTEEPELGPRSEKLTHSGYRPPVFPESETSLNLGSVAQDQTIPLTTRNANFLLVTRITSAERDCELHVISSLEEIDHEGRVRSTLQLYNATRGAECGE